MDEYDNNDYGTEIDDSQRLDELSTMEDYNRWEEEQVARDMDDGEVEDQLLDMEMEDRIGGTGCEDFGDCYSE
jgi:hypothetical protein